MARRNHLPVIMILGAQSTHSTLGSVPQEVSNLKEIITAYPHEKPTFQLEYEPFLTNEYLKSRLDQFKDKIAILHFAGHSNAKGLVSNDSVIYSQHLAEIFSRWKSPPRLIFLNGCQNSEQVSLFHGAGASMVIATCRPIGDQKAASFSQEFYRSLFANERTDVQTAFADAGSKVLLPNDQQERSLDIETLSTVSDSDWDWGLFSEQFKHREATFTHLISEDRPRYDGQGSLLNPYRGLEAFREEDRAYFFGREALSIELCEKIPTTPLLILLGASGSGKSSLISAGIIPGLPDKKTWLVLKIRPGNAPFSELSLCLAEYFYPEPQQAVKRLQKKAELEVVLAGQQITLAELLPELLKRTDKTGLLLVIDQFEELFTQSEMTATKSFLLLLTQLVDARLEQCHLTLVMRADFLSAALAYPVLAKLLDEYPPKLLAPMGKAELRTAIEKPAAKQRVEIENSLTEELLDAVEHQAGSLPLLQHVLDSLWEKCRGHFIRLEDYTQLGGLEKALEKRADAIFEAFSPSEQLHCQHIFLRLVQPGDGTEDTRRRAMLNEFGDDPDVLHVIKTLADTRLITTQQDDKNEFAYAEVSHEALIQHWRRLREWITGNRTTLRTQVQIARGAKDWQERNEQKDWLFSGTRLIAAEEWLAEHQERATGIEIKFITASTSQHEHSRKMTRLNILKAVTSLAMITIIAVWQMFEAKQAKEEAETQVKITQEQILEANYNLAKVLEEKANFAFNKGMQLELGDAERNAQLRHALLYALEAQRKSVPVGRKSVNLETLHSLSVIDVRWLTPERKQTPTLWRGANKLIYSPNGKVIASDSFDKTVRLWDAQSGKTLKIMRGYLSNSGELAYSPDGKVIASVLDDNAIRLWDVQSGKTLQTLRGHTSEVRALIYSPDGRVIASGSAEGKVRLWDAQNGKPLKILQHDTGLVNALAYSPDGKVIASGSSNSTVQLWDAQSGERMKILQGHTNDLFSLAYSPNGKVIVSGARDNMVRLWDAQSGEPIKVLQGHTDSVYALAYSPDGKTIVSASGDNTIRLWDAQSGETLETLQENFIGTASSLAYSPDGKVIATAQLWDAQSGQRLKKLRGHTGSVYSLAYSPDNKVIASGSSDNTLRLWDAQSGEALRTLQGHTKSISSLVYSPDGKVIASGSGDNTVRLWDAKSGKSLKTLQGHTDGVNALVYSPDGKVLVSGADDNTLRLWNVRSGEMLKTLQGHTSVVNTVAYSKDGRVIASGSGGHLGLSSNDHSVRLWDSQSGETLKILRGYSSAINALVYSPDDKVIASASGNTVRLLDAESGELLKSLEEYNNNSAIALAYSPDGKVIASVLTDSTVQLWDVKSGEPLKTLQGHRGFVEGVAFSSDGKVLASGSRDNTLRLWDAQSNETLKSLQGHTDDINALAYSPDGKVIASGAGGYDSGADYTVRLWDAQSGETLNILQGHTHIVSALAYSPNGNIIASGSGDNTVRLWDAQSGGLLKILKTFRHGGGPVNALAFSPDGKVLSIGFSNLLENIVQQWDTQSGEMLRTLRGSSKSAWTYSINALAYSPNGNVIASGSSDKMVQLWDVKSGELLKTLQGHTEDISSLVYSPDGNVIASGSGDNTVRVWDAKNGKMLKALQGHTGWVGSLAYSPDGNVIASGSGDNTVRLWDVESGEQLKKLQGHAGGVSALAYSPDGKMIASGSEDNTVRLWNANDYYPLSKLLYQFDPVVVADALAFLWNLRLDELKFVPNYPTPALLPQKGYYITWDEHTEKFRPLLNSPRPNETKIDQLIRWLEDRKLYRKSPAGAPAQ